MSKRYRMNGLTDYLFAMPTFWSGFGRALDIGAQFDEFNWCEDPAESDANAIYSDFRAVGMDIMTACPQYETEIRRRPEDAAPPR